MNCKLMPEKYPEQIIEVIKIIGKDVSLGDFYTEPKTTIPVSFSKHMRDFLNDTVFYISQMNSIEYKSLQEEINSFIYTLGLNVAFDLFSEDKEEKVVIH
jgi:hypothetical protein